MDRAMSAGYGEILGSEIKAALYGTPNPPAIDSFIYGLGGRDIHEDEIIGMINRPNPGTHRSEWVGLRPDLLEE
jgi:pyruvate/2-oxoacid:ferredoxin oxidoreductase alpha subunit